MNSPLQEAPQETVTEINIRFSGG